MRSYKLFDLLATFSPVEIRQVRKILRSPFFVQRESTLELFELSVKYLEKKGVPPPLEVISKTLFPKLTFDAIRVRSLMSDLLHILEEWLIIQEYRKDQIKKQLTLSTIYRIRELDKSYRSSIKKTEVALNDYPFRNQSFYELQLALHEEKMIFQRVSKRTENLYFQEISENTDVTFLIRKLKNACSLLTHQSVMKTEYDFGLLDSFIDQLEESKYIDIPVVSIYYNCFRFLKEKNSLPYFQKFKQTLTAHRQKLKINDLKGPYLLGINFCIKKLNQGSRAFAKEGLDLYREGVNEKILLENNMISRFTFNNMVAMALFLEEYEWLDDFIRLKSSYLSMQYRDQTISFNKARLSFARHQFDDALVHLQSAEYKDLVNILISKMLLLQIYYELNAFDSLESHLDSFKQFIRRREVSDYHRANFVNIIGFVRKLIQLPVYEKVKRRELKDQIQAESILSIKGWLLEKVDQL